MGDKPQIINGNLIVPTGQSVGFGAPTDPQVLEATGPQVHAVTSDPNGNLVAPIGSIALRGDTGALYQNTNGLSTWVQVGATGAQGGYSLPAAVESFTGTISQRASASLTLPTLADGETAIYDVDTFFSSGSSDGVATFTMTIDVGKTGPAGYALAPYKNGNVPAVGAEGTLVNQHARLLFRRQGASIFASASYYGTFFDGTFASVGEIGPDEPINDNLFTNGGPLFIGINAGFSNADPGNTYDLVQFTVTRIR
jgi:hypothetical protein